MTETSPTTRARVLAVIYIILIASGITAQAVISDGLVVRDDAAKTAANILGNKDLYRLGFTIFMIEMLAQIAVTGLFYDLLKPVNRSVARLSAMFGLVATGIKTVARVLYYAPLILLGGASYLSVFEPAQLEALSLASVRLNGTAANMALPFFGLELVLRGWLMFKSDFLPRFLGVVTAVSGAAWILFAWPPLGSAIFVGAALAAVGSLIVTWGWFFVRGVDDAKWKACATQSAGSVWR